MFWAAPAHAQESGLRGAVAETEITGSLLPRAPDQTEIEPIQPFPRYVPVSPGAVADETAAGSDSIFAPDVADDPFADDPPIPSRVPTTARRRVEEARARPQTASERRAAETAENDTLDEDITGTERVDTIDSAEDLVLDEGAGRVEAIEGLDGIKEDNPFAATGIRVGTFIIRPTLEQGVTATSNADASSGGEPATLSETTLRLNAISDWSRHTATIDAYGNFRKTISGDEIDETKGGIDAALVLDLGNDYRARAELGYEAGPESASSPVVIEGTASQPLRQTFNASLGLEKDVGKARFGITGLVEHQTYGDADLSSGGTLSQEDRDFTLGAVVLRGGYEISPALTPFVEAEFGRRQYTMEEDASGFQRSSDRVGARAGLELDLTEKLTGEFSAGWIRETFDDDRLDPLSGPTLNADLAWSPERGTVVNLSAATSVEGTTTAGESGSILHAARLGIEREIRANLTANASVGAGYRDYAESDGHDLILSAEAGATWWLNRYAGLSGRLRHETMDSNLPDREYEANSVFLGLKLQR
ncbi:outer membrane beta-barrel protein [Mesorhizobium sp. WSM2240]|uniref:Outer membrane beta-barrel protein n=1 Tax=Mesorhizobium sp. WSM2239 TaxID=3228852 RepID=A0AAU8DEF7_9HYPH